MKTKKILTILIGACMILQSPYSKGNIPGRKKADDKAGKFIQPSSVGFEENKGQFVNTKGEAVPDILFKASFKGTDMYITKNGLSYVFLKIHNTGDSIKEELEKKQEKNVNKNIDGLSGATKLNVDMSKRKMEWYRMDMTLKEAVIKKENIKMEYPVEQGYLNYYMSQYPGGILNVRTYQKITIRSVYPGIDWVIYYDDKNGLEYDFELQPGANPDNICMKYTGSTEIINENESSRLTIKTPMGEVKEGALLCYEAGTKKEIRSHYEVKENEVRFKLSNYNSKNTLIIDPPLKLVWSTYYEGTTNGNSITTDNEDNVYITGYGSSTATYDPGGGAYYSTSGLAYVLKFNSSGVRQWATLFDGVQASTCITTDQGGNVYISGYTSYTDLPILQSSKPGAYYQSSNAGGDDIFISKFNKNGVLKWSTYYGGSADEKGTAYNFDNQGPSITADKTGHIYITGNTRSTNFPTLNPGGSAYYKGTLQGDGTTANLIRGDAFILKFDTSGVRKWATYFGGNLGDDGHDVATDNNGNVFIAGATSSKEATFPLLNPGGSAFYDGVYSGNDWQESDGFTAKFDANGVLKWSTYSPEYDLEAAVSITADNSENVIVMYCTDMKGYGNEIYIAKYSSSLNKQWGGYYGGSGPDYPNNPCSDCIAVDSAGNIYSTWETHSSLDVPSRIPGNCSYYQDQISGTGSSGAEDAFILNLRPNSKLYWGTYFGGSGDSHDQGRGVATDSEGCLYVLSRTDCSADFPLVDNGGYYYDQMPGIIISKFCPCCNVNADASPDTTICKGNSAILNATGNGTFHWSTEETTQDIIVSPTTTTSYFVTVTSPNGTCAEYASVTVTVYPLPSTPVITLHDDTLISNVTSGNQWYNSNGLIDGATGNAYVPEETGDYYVIVTNDGCVSDTSNIIQVIITGVAGNKEITEVKIYPNPAKDKLFVEITQTSQIKELSVFLYDLKGQMQLQQLIQQSKTEIDISDFAKGIYILKVRNTDGVIVKRIMKE